MTASADALAFIAETLRSEMPGTERPLPRRFLADAPWERIVRLANRHLLGPALHEALIRQPHYGHVPEEPRKYLALLHRLNLRRNAVIRRQLRELIRRMNAEGIEPLVVKGALRLVSEPRAGMGSRMMADVDVAVPWSRKSDALAALRALRYRIREQYPEGHHAFAELVRDGDPAAVDLHFELIDHDDVLPARMVQARAARMSQGGARFRVPVPTDRLTHNLLHAQIHHRANFYRAAVDLRQLHEFAVLCAYHGDRIDWSTVRLRMAQHRLTTPLESWLLLAHRLFGVEWPYPRPPSRRARLHAARCLAQLRHPGLERLSLPLANLRAGFAWHRMSRYYRQYRGGPLAWRWRHLRQFVARHGLGIAISRVFRY